MVDFLLYQWIEGEYTTVLWIPVVGLFFVEFSWFFCAQNVSQRFPQKRDSTPTFWLDEVLAKMTPPESERTVEQGPFQKESLVFQPSFFRGYSLVFRGLLFLIFQRI